MRHNHYPICAMAVLAPLGALAHTGDLSHHAMPGFLDGLLHPISGPDHLLTWLALGLLLIGVARLRVLGSRWTGALMSSALAIALLYGYLHVLVAPATLSSAAFLAGMGLSSLCLLVAGSWLGLRLVDGGERRRSA